MDNDLGDEDFIKGLASILSELDREQLTVKRLAFNLVPVIGRLESEYRGKEI